MVVAQNNYGKGVTFRPGTYKRPFVVPSVRQFTDYCIKIQVQLNAWVCAWLGF